MSALSYPNLTLSSSALDATWFLPAPTVGARAYYTSTRFDWGTMLGNVRFASHIVLDDNYWKASRPSPQTPHDPTWTESGLGLASEWGCGDDGAHCGEGWGAYPEGATNGILGYEEAVAGGAFLKIGVGKLIKGSCVAMHWAQACNSSDPDDIYHFGSPYVFAEPPQWNVSQSAAGEATMTHAASVGTRWGYYLRRTVRLVGNQLTVDTFVQNTGTERFAAPYYAHNFLSIDRQPVGPGWKLSLDDLPDITSGTDRFTPLADFFDARGSQLTAVAPINNTVLHKFGGALDVGSGSQGRFTATAHGVSISKQLDGPLPLYQYNLYAEETTLSPEPSQLVRLDGGQSVLLSASVTLSQA